jgi:hypothetical protein
MGTSGDQARSVAWRHPPFSNKIWIVNKIWSKFKRILNKFRIWKKLDMNNFWIVNKIKFEQNLSLNKFGIWTNLECEQKSLCE